MQRATGWIANRWRSGCAGKLMVIIGGMILGCCLLSVPVAIINPSTPTPSTRTQPVVDIAPTATATDTAEPTATATAEPATNTPAPTDTPIPTDTPAPTQPPTAPPPTSTPRPAAPVVVPPVVPPVRSGGAVNPFTCAGGCTTAPDPSCNIKGNVNSRGERIYHTPALRDYDRTNVRPEEGDRWFCTEEEARAAGFRRAQR